ncbi:hypothetical protein KBD81_00185 [Candidatus Woesebacteria bacterium]|nr:hypothetical protein [Candidatus Woesebacteria bacterium]
MIHTFFKNSLSFALIVFLLFSLVSPAPAFAQMKEWNNIDGNGTSCLVNDVPTLKCLEVVTGNLLFMVNGLILLVLFIMFVIGSYKYLLSLGQPEKIEDAKKTFTWAIIGIVVYSSAYLILLIIDNLFLGGNGTIFQLNIGGP